MEDKMPRVLFAAPKSGSGKTTVTCGLLALLKKKNYKVLSLKCGPDYIDPMFHRKVLGIPSGNLDSFFTDEKTTRYLLMQKMKGKEIAVLEGVMGYYDGLGGQSEAASTYEVAKVTKTPVILVVDGKGASVSLAPMIKGLTEYRSDSNIRGVILNRVSGSYYDRIKAVIERECRIEVLGYLPDKKELLLPSRHLGLVSPQEIKEFENWCDTAAKMAERFLNVDRILEIAGEAKPFSEVSLKEGEEAENSLPHLEKRVRLAVARDEAFSFYYEENMELLNKMGADLVPFSPLHDTKLPEEIDGIFLGGGYPELFAKELSENRSMREEIRKLCEKKIPVFAECGGFLYLNRKMTGEDGTSYPMVGALEGEGFFAKKLSRFGYVELSLKRGGLLGDQNETIRGHEFHYWDCTENGADVTAKKPLSDQSYDCMVHTEHMAAGFPHLYFYSNPRIPFSFLEACFRYQIKRRAKKHWDELAKPIDGLGLLEDLIVKLCKISKEIPPKIEKKALLILASDHGVTAEGVTQTNSSVTRIVTENFAMGKSTVNCMARCAGADVFAVDIGMDCPDYPAKELALHVVTDRKIARGSGNIAAEPAMTIDQCKKAIETGISLVRELKEMGYQILATGEMGIGNTTPASALASIFLHLPAREVTGKGAGLSADGLERKVRVVDRVVCRTKEKNLKDPMEILAEAGGYEIAGMTGVFLGGVKYRLPIVIDGAISAVAALAAYRMDARVADFAVASHLSGEKTGELALSAMGLSAILHGRMCLGEGSGAVALFPLLDMAAEVYRSMGTFEDCRIEAYQRLEE